MKRRLQELWDEVVPMKGPSPQPEAKAVLARVEASLEDKPRWGRRSVKLVVILAAVLILMMTTVSAYYGLLGRSIFGVFFGGGETEYADSLAETEPLSVSDKNFTLTVTSSISDRNKVYCTFEVRAKTEWGQNYLKLNDLKDNFFVEDRQAMIEIETTWNSHISMRTDTYHKEDGVYWEAMVIDQWEEFQDGRTIKARIKDMEEDLWLEFPVRPAPTVELEINADGWGAGFYGEGPVHLENVTLSPLGITANYTASEQYHIGSPALYILWKDGSFSTMGQLGEHMGDGGSFPNDGSPSHLYRDGKFDKVQDITKMEAVVFEDMAYPLDGGTAYPVDTSGLPRPFHLPLSQRFYTGNGGYGQMIPIFSLCEKLGISCEWDAETGKAVMTYRGVTVTIQVGSDEVLIDGVPEQDRILENVTSAYLKDGELWSSINYPAWGLRITDSHDRNNMAWDGVETFRLIVP